MSNKTLKENAKKTKSALKQITFTALLLILFPVFAIAYWMSQGSQVPSDKQRCLVVHGGDSRDQCDAKLEVVDTPESRTLGLSGRENLPAGSGMLFDFERASNYCIWMKDMRFDIDIIWLDESGKVLKQMSEVSPSTYPASYCATGTRYVIELPAGEARRNSISEGMHLSF